MANKIKGIQMLTSTLIIWEIEAKMREKEAETCRECE